MENANANADFIPIIILLAVAGAFLWLHFTGGSGRTRLYLAAALTALAVLILLPSISGALPDWWTSTIPTPKIQLGLDLQGGTHLLLEVKLDEAVKTQLRRVADDVKQEMKQNKLEVKSVTVDPSGRRVAGDLAQRGRADRFSRSRGQAFFRHGDRACAQLW